MRKYIVLLSLLLALVLTACGSADTAAPDRGTVQPGFDSAIPGEVQTGTDGDTADNADNDTADDAAEPTSGSVNGGVYTSTFAGVGCALDDSWTFYTDEQIAALNGLLTSQSDSDDLRALLENSDAVYDMYASSTNGLMTMNVVFQNLGLLGTGLVTAQDYVELSVEQLPDALTAYGFTDVEAAVTAADFAGQTDCPAIDISAKLGDTTMYEQLICLKTGSYIYCVTLCSFTENVTADMAALFYGL